MGTATIRPAYRDRPPDPRLYYLAIARYEALEAARRRRAILAAYLVAPHRTGEIVRPPWVGLVIDYAAAPAVVAILAGMAVSGHPWILPAGLAHLGAVWAVLRWESRAGAGRVRAAAADRPAAVRGWPGPRAGHDGAPATPLGIAGSGLRRRNGGS